MIYSGTFTVRNPKTGDYRTFLIKKAQPQDHKFQPGKRLVGLLTGSDNYHDFKLFGYVDEESERIIVFHKHRGMMGEPSHFEWFARMLNVLVAQSETDSRFTDYSVQESRTCMRCGLKLTTPESIEAGLGAECAEKWGVEHKGAV